MHVALATHVFLGSSPSGSPPSAHVQLPCLGQPSGSKANAKIGQKMGGNEKLFALRE